MLDLDPRVHLQEEVLAILEQSFDRSGARVGDGGGRLGRDLPDPLAKLLVHRRGRRLLDQLLVSALERAIALAQVDDVAVRVGEDLHLDVTGIGQVALEIHRGVAEELLPLARRPLEGLLQLVLAERDTESLSATPAGGLDRDGIPDRLRDELAGVLDRLYRLGGSGMIGTPALCISSLARVFEPIASIADDGGPMNTIPRFSSAFAKAAFSARKP